MEDKRTYSCVIPLGMAWGCCLFTFAAYQSLTPKISFQHHAFFFTQLYRGADSNLKLTITLNTNYYEETLLFFSNSLCCIVYFV